MPASCLPYPSLSVPQSATSPPFQAVSEGVKDQRQKDESHKKHEIVAVAHVKRLPLLHGKLPLKHCLFKKPGPAANASLGIDYGAYARVCRPQNPPVGFNGTKNIESQVLIGSGGPAEPGVVRHVYKDICPLPYRLVRNGGENPFEADQNADRSLVRSDGLVRFSGKEIAYLDADIGEEGEILAQGGKLSKRHEMDLAVCSQCPAVTSEGSRGIVVTMRAISGYGTEQKGAGKGDGNLLNGLLERIVIEDEGHGGFRPDNERGFLAVPHAEIPVGAYGVGLEIGVPFHILGHVPLNDCPGEIPMFWNLQAIDSKGNGDDKEKGRKRKKRPRQRLLSYGEGSDAADRNQKEREKVAARNGGDLNEGEKIMLRMGEKRPGKTGQEKTSYIFEDDPDQWGGEIRLQPP